MACSPLVSPVITPGMVKHEMNAENFVGKGTEPTKDTEEIEGGMAECSEADGEIFPSP